jgi:hypothetical protein
VLRGTRLGADQREQFLNDAESIYRVRSSQHERDLNYARELATAQDLNPDQVARDLRLPEDPAAAPRAGASVTDRLPARGEYVGDSYRDAQTGDVWTWNGRQWTRARPPIRQPGEAGWNPGY